MNRVHRLSESSSLLSPAQYLAEVRAALAGIEQLLQNAEGFEQVDARERLRALAESADSVLANLARTAVTRGGG